MDRLLVKCLLSEATASERAQVDAWKAADAANRRYSEDFERIWVDTGRLAPNAAPDESAAWERFRRSERFPAPRLGFVVPMERRQRFSRPWMAAAAILLLSGPLAWLLIVKKDAVNNGNQLLSLQTTAMTRTDTLPDGTRVTLNKHSSLVYPQRFKEDQREVSLKGEGFFEVVHRAKQPFIVRLKGLTIRDIGTSFNVKVRPGEIEVTVATGEVEITNGGAVIEAGAGERVVIPDDPAATRTMPSADDLYRYYVTKEFVCRKTPLWKLVDVLNEAYGAHIVIEDKGIRDLPLTATFLNESLDSLLGVVTQTLGLNLTHNGTEIFLKK